MALRSPLTVQPYDYIADSNGRPLDYGQVYIGVANQDPEFYQTPVYLDAAMTKPIDQPIRTNDGFIDFAGSLSELYASAEVYSVKVLDKEGRKVLYKGDMTRKNLMSDALADLNQSIIDTQTAAQITLNAAVNSANTEVAQTVSLATAAIDTATTKSNKAATDADAAIKVLFENGGLPATPFKTKLLMESSELVDGSYAMVTDDNDNNGLYVKEGGVWTKSKYDNVESLLDAVDSRISLFLAHKKDDSSLLAVEDARGNIVARIDTDGDLHLTRMDSPVQDAISKLGLSEGLIIKDDKGDTLLAIEDARGNVVARIDADGDLHLTRMGRTVQDAISRLSASEGLVTKEDRGESLFALEDSSNQLIARVAADGSLHLTGLANSVQQTVAELKQSILDLKNANEGLGQAIVMKKAPMAFERVPQPYSVPTQTLLGIDIPQENITAKYLDTPYATQEAIIHPDVISLEKPMMGYKYLLCATPYPDYDTAKENPVLWGSNDKENWEMLKWIEQPLDHPPQVDEPDGGRDGYLSDNWLSYDPINHELLLCYRKNYYADGLEAGYTTRDTSELLYRKTVNGLHWSEPEKLVPTLRMFEESYISPNMIYDTVNSRWVLFYGGYVSFNESLDPESWSPKQSIGLHEFNEQNNLKSWHYGTGWIGDKLCMIIGDSAETVDYYFAVCEPDNTFLNWNFTTKPLIQDWRGAYKGSFIAEMSEDSSQLQLNFYFTKGGAGALQNAHYTINL